MSDGPTLYPQIYDAARDAAYVIGMDAAAYRAASFLDERVQRPGEWQAWPQIEAMATAAEPRPLHVIFHTGHVGSTLLSRLIDETGVVLGLREPLPLRTLAQMQDAGDPRFTPRLAGFVRLWSRGFLGTHSVVLKATSTGGRIAPQLLDARPDARAVYLNLEAEPYLATLLAGANTLTDLKGFEAERAARLRTLSGAAWQATSVGELAAMTWLSESLTRARALEGFKGRVLPLDFEAMLADLPGTLGAVLAHLRIPAPPGFAASVARSPVLTRYSKAPQQFEYSPHFRGQLLAQARREHAAEIRKGLSFLERIAAQDSRAAALL
jgi:hypothetical protein